MCNMKKTQQQESRLLVKSTGEDRCPLPDLAVLIDIFTICTACQCALAGKQHPADLPVRQKVCVTSNPLQATKLGLLKTPLGLFKMMFLNKADYLKKIRSTLLIASAGNSVENLWKLLQNKCLALPQIVSHMSLSCISV